MRVCAGRRPSGFPLGGAATLGACSGKTGGGRRGRPTPPPQTKDKALAGHHATCLHTQTAGQTKQRACRAKTPAPGAREPHTPLPSQPPREGGGGRGCKDALGSQHRQRRDRSQPTGWRGMTGGSRAHTHTHYGCAEWAAGVRPTPRHAGNAHRGPTAREARASHARLPLQWGPPGAAKRCCRGDARGHRRQAGTPTTHVARVALSPLPLPPSSLRPRTLGATKEKRENSQQRAACARGRTKAGCWECCVCVCVVFAFACPALAQRRQDKETHRQRQRETRKGAKCETPPRVCGAYMYV